ncbi:hypothetical protein [Dethiosulfovibrio salsuginis]|nr:hypothetical protein [Dethiosulfovibrio salsuginis]
MVLIVLMVGSAFVFTALYMVENFHSSSSRSVRRMELYSLAMSELEGAKGWLGQETESKPYPVGKYNDKYVPAWDEKPADGVPFDSLVVLKNGSPVVRDRTSGIFTSRTVIYDLVYKSNLGYVKVVPQGEEGVFYGDVGGESEKEENYKGEEISNLLVYLIRTTVSDDQGRSITLEQRILKLK